VHNYQLIPPSLHPSGARYEWIKPIDFDEPNYGIYPLVDSEVEAILGELGHLEQVRKEAVEAIREPRKAPGPKLRELSDADILKIKELLREAYRPGFRQYLVLYLSGWLAKAGISPLSAVKLVKVLYEDTGDTDPLKTRLSAVVYSYKKAGVDVDAYAKEIEELTGVRPYGLEKEISEEEVKGKAATGNSRASSWRGASTRGDKGTRGNSPGCKPLQG